MHGQITSAQTIGWHQETLLTLRPLTLTRTQKWLLSNDRSESKSDTSTQAKIPAVLFT